MDKPDFQRIIEKLKNNGFMFEKAIIEYDNEGLTVFREFDELGLCSAGAEDVRSIQIWGQDRTCFFIRNGTYLCNRCGGIPRDQKSVLEDEFGLRMIELPRKMYPKVFGASGQTLIPA